MINFKKLIEAGVPFGHPTSRWNPKMAPYVWGRKNGVYLINVLDTARLLEEAGKFLKSIAAQNKTILWVGTKKAARSIIADIGIQTKSPYVAHRWVGGTLTNYAQVRKPIVKLLHFQDILSKAGSENKPEQLIHYTKKEFVKLEKEAESLRNTFGGLVNFKWPLGAVVIVDVRKEQAALKEAVALGVPVVALVDTNSDPELVNYVIPGNDDGRDSIKVILDYLAQAVVDGKEQIKEAADAKETALEAHELKPEAIIIEEDVTDVASADKDAKVSKRFKDASFAPKGEPKKKVK